MKNVRLLAIALVSAMVAVFLVFSYVKKKEKSILDMGTPVQVAVAVVNIGEGSRLDQANIILKEIPKRFVQPDAITNIESLYDQVVAIPVLENTQILETMLSTPEQIGLAQHIPKDKVGYTISVNNVTGVAGLLEPGDFVDIIMTAELGNYSEENGITNHETISLVALENTMILAVDQRSRKKSFSQGFRLSREGKGSLFNTNKTQDTQASTVKTITVAVNIEDCLKLNMAQEIGSISLALRSSWAGDTTWDIEKLNSYDLLGVEKPILKKSIPAWVEIRGAEQTSRF